MRTPSLLALVSCLAPVLPTARAQTPITSVVVQTGLSAPLYLCAPPGDASRLFVVERGGAIRIIRNGALLPTPFLNVSSIIVAGGERGLLGMAFHPRYATNGQFYVNFTQNAAPSGATVVRRYRVSSGNPDVADPASGATLLTIAQPFSNHNGGCLQFGPDGYLWIGMGDGGSANDPNNNAQNVNSLLGKMLRIDVDTVAPPLPYGIPANNPFAAGGGSREVWAVGMRNPFRFSFDRMTGDVWIGDVGQNAREEVSYQGAAALFAAPGTFPAVNFGWRCREGDIATPGIPTPCNPATGTTFTAPVHAYANSPGFAVIGGYVYRGCAIPDLRGTYFFAEHGGNQVWSFLYDGTSVTNFTPRTTQLGGGFSQISSFGEDGCGELYIVQLGGTIRKIVPSATPPMTGLVPYGTGTAGCSGAHALGGNLPSLVANPCWRLTCTNAPPNALGAAMIGNVPDVAGSDPLQLGILLHVNIASPFLFTFFGMASDAGGNGSLRIPIPNAPGLVGWTLYAQALWDWTAGPCQPSISRLSSSNGLAMTFGP